MLRRATTRNKRSVDFLAREVFVTWFVSIFSGAVQGPPEYSWPAPIKVLAGIFVWCWLDTRRYGNRPNQLSGTYG